MRALLAALLCSASFLAVTHPALAGGGALPGDGKYVLGKGSIQAGANNITVNQSTGAGIINWRSFSIGAGNSVFFNNGSGSTLNRVTGGNLSQIYGTLGGTGSVYLINPQGIVIGPGGKVVTNGSFVASTRDISNSSFLGGGPLIASGTSSGNVVNAGTITSKSGDAILVGRSVGNSGTINAPNGTVGLAAGNRIVLQPVGGDSRIAVSGGTGAVTNSGTVKAAQAELAAAGGDVYDLAKNRGGLVSATGTATVGGHVWLTAGGTATVGGTVAAQNADGSGGAVTVRAQNIVQSGSVDASAVAPGATGGNVSIVASDTATIGGTISAKGGDGGTGGFVETSGLHLHVLDAARILTDAFSGIDGKWLIDPADFTVAASGGDITGAVLSSNLATTDVTISSSAGTVNTSGAGDVNVNDAVSWSSGHSLTLNAYRNVNVNANVTSSGGGAVTLHADDTGTGSGTATFGSGDKISTSGVVSIYYDPTGDSTTVNGTKYTSATQTNFSGDVAGGATLDSIMLVNSLTDLQNVQNNLSARYALGRDIDASGTASWNSGQGFTPIGNETTAFTGVFDGQSHAIGGLIIDRTTDIQGVGLFGGLDGGALVENLALTNVQITGGSVTGGLVGLQLSGTISGVSVTGSVTDNNSADLGGIAGVEIGAITSSFTDVTVSSTGTGSRVGGLVGLANGLVGGSQSITSSYSLSSVTGDNAGGLVGVSLSFPLSISNSYAAGAVVGHTASGGLVGSNNTQVAFSNSYWDVGTTGQSSAVAPGSTGQTMGTATGESTAQLQGTLPGGFGSSTWGTGTGLYPYLKSSFPTGVEAISGTAYKDAGIDLASGGTVDLDSGGVPLGQGAIGANGYYYIAVSAGSIANSSNLLVSVPTTGSVAVNGATLATSTYAGADTIQTGVNLYGGFLLETTSATTLSGAPSLASFQSAANTVAGTDTTATGVIAAIANPGYLTTGSSFTVDQTVNGSGLLVITGAGDPITVSSAITIASGGSLGLISGGALDIDAPITAKGTVSVALGYDAGDPTNLSFGLTSAGFLGSLSFTNADGSVATASQGGSLAIDGAAYTLLYSASGLDAINTAGALTGNYAVATDLDASSISSWAPIGTTSAGGAINNGFAGNFTGLGHTVLNLTANLGSRHYVGLFGYASGTLRDIGVAGGSVSGSDQVGDLVGGTDGAIIDAYATGAVHGGSGGSGNNAGGLAGYAGLVADSYATGNVSGDNGVGGLLGTAGGPVTNAYATGAVSGNTYVAGLVAYGDVVTIDNVYATGAVSGGSSVGALVAGGSGTTITHAYATGAVGSGGYGLLADSSSGNSAANSYWDTQTTGTSSSAGGGTAQTTAQLQGTLPSGFDSTVWGTGTGLYPYLKSFFPNGVQAVSGTAYKDAAVNVAASGSSGAVTVNLDAGGALLGQATTGANGYYYIALPAGAIANGSNLLVSTPTAGSIAVNAATLAASTYAGADTIQSNVNLYGGFLSEATSATLLSAAPSLASLKSTADTVAGTDATATATVAGVFGPGYLTTGTGFTVDQTYSGAGLFVQTGSGDPITVANAITITSGGSLALISGGALDIDAPITAEGAVSVALGYDSSNPANLSFGLTATGFTGSLSFTNADGSAATSAQGGSLVVNSASYTLLYSMSDIQGINGNLSGNYALAGSLDAFSTTGWVALGTDGAGNVSNSGNGFSGNFTGLGHAITNLTVGNGTANDIGLFGYTSGTVRDIGLTGLFGLIFGNSGVGALAGYNAGTVADAYATENLGGFFDVGGLVGQNAGSIADVYATGDVTGYQQVGGLVGLNSGTITKAYATDWINANTDVGGLVGRNSGAIANAFAMGAVSGGTGDAAGGLVGNNASGGTITNAYAAGAVNGNTDLGGFAGLNGGTVTNGYWDTQTSGMSSSSAGTGQTTAQLQGALPSGFDGTVWGTGTGLYPYLTTFFPNGVEAVSGTAYKDAGVHILASILSNAAVVDLDSGGALLSQASIGANGYYYVALPAGSVANGHDLLVSTPTESTTGAVNAATLAASTYTAGTPAQTGVDLYGGFLAERSGATTLSAAPSLAALQSTANAVAGSDGTASGVVGALTQPGYLTTGSSFTVDQSYSGAGLLITTGAGDPITVSNAITIADGGSLGLLSGGALNIDAPIKAEGATSVALAYDYSDPTNLSFGLTSLGFTGSLGFTKADGSTATSAQGGSLIVNGASYTLLYSMSDVAGINASDAALQGNYALAGSLDASSVTGWIPLGTDGASNVLNGISGFSGGFTGLGHTIANLTVDIGSNTYAGLFGYASGVLRDIGLTGSAVTGRVDVGALAGYSHGQVADAYAIGTVGSDGIVGGLVGENWGTITGAYAIGTVNGGVNAGGLVGVNNSGIITDAYAAGTVTGTGTLGGLVGGNSSGTITNAYATATVSGDNSIGGLVGSNSRGSITNAYATGAVSGDNSIGGLVGFDNRGSITHAYATGAVSGNSAFGGLVGMNDSGVVTDAYWDTQTSGIGTSAAGTGLTTAQLQGTPPGSFDGAVWGTGAGLYPYLKSFFPNGVEAVSGTAYKDAGVNVAASGSAGAVTVNLDGGGALLGQATTGANGYYYIALPAGSIGNGANLLVSTPTTGSIAVNAATLAISTYSSGTPDENVNLYGGFLSAQTAATTLSAAPSLAGLRTAANTIAGSDTTATGIVGALAQPGYLTTGSSFTFEHSYTGAGLLIVTGSGDPITVNNPVTITDGGSLALLSGGALDIDAPIKAEGATAVTLAYDNSDPTNLSFGLISTGFTGSLSFTNADGSTATSSQGGSLAVNGASYTLLYAMSDVVAINASDAALQGNYALAGSLDASLTTGWTPLGTDGAGNVENAFQGFTGSLTGLGHIIANLAVNTGSADFVGLFGKASGTLRDLGLAGGSVEGGSYVGGLAGFNAGQIADVYASIAVSGTNWVGGLVGDNHGAVADAYDTGAVGGSGNFAGGLAGANSGGGTIVDAYATGTVSGNFGAGGLIGSNSQSSLNDVFATGAVSGSSYVGGLAGESDSSSIANAYAMGAVRGSSGVGGLVGYYGIGSIANVYATGAVSGSANVGGLIGQSIVNGVPHGYWDTQTSGQSSGGASATTGETTAALQGTLPSGFDSTVWGTGAGLYPYLKSFFPNGVEAITGTAYSDAAGTAALAGATVKAMTGGASAGLDASTGANGYYYLLVAPGTFTGAQQLVTYVSGNTIKANSFVQNVAGTTSGVDLYAGTLYEQTGAGVSGQNTLSGIVTALDSAVGGTTGGDLLYTSGAGLAAGTAVSIKDSATAGLAIDATLNVGSARLAIAAAGALTQSAAITAGTLALADTASVTLSNTSNAIATVGGATGALILADSTDLAVGAGGLASSGAVKLTSTGNLTLNGGVTGGSGSDVVLGAAGNFVNNAGSGAVVTSGGGRWLVYSSAPGTDSFGDLDSGNTAVWNSTIATLAPGSVTQAGNRYIFADQPTLTITTTDTSKTYGNDAASGVAAAYQVSGLVAAVAHAFLGDSAADVYSGAPTVTSAGSAMAASVSGGPYLISAAQGGFTVGDGYGLAISNVGHLTVTARPITVTADAQSRRYGDANPGLTYTVGGDGLVNGDTLTGALTTAASATTSVGGYAITQGTLAASSNYDLTGFTAGTLTVTARPITVTADSQSRRYGDANPGLTYTVGGDGLVNGDTLAGALTTGASTASSVGGYAITQGTLAASTNYALTYVAGTLSVTARPVTVTADDLSRIYGDANPALTYSIGGNGLVNGDSLSGVLSTSATTASNVGFYGIGQGTLAASSNYALTYVAGTLSVTARPVTVTADDLSRIYGDANPGLTYTVGGDGLVNGDTLTGALTTAASATTSVGGYAITQGTLAASSNYDLTGFTAGTLTVTARPITVTADSQSRRYGDANPGLTYTVGGDGLVNGDTLAGALTTGASTASSVGGYAITQGTLAASTNYALTYVAGTLSVTARPVTVTADDLSRIYGDANPALTYSIGGNGLVNGDSLSGVLSTSATTASNVGFYGIGQGTLAASSNYALTYVAGTLSVTARPVTVTADDLSRIYGDANPALTYSIGGNGLVNGDSLSGALSTSATTASNVGFYGIGQGTLAASSNYALTYVAGTLSVMARPVTVTADDESRFIGQNNPPLAYQLTAGTLVNGDSLSGTLATSASLVSPPGRYAITQGSLAASSNYALTFVPGMLAVAAVPPPPLFFAIPQGGGAQAYVMGTPTSDWYFNTWTVDEAINPDDLPVLLGTETLIVSPDGYGWVATPEEGGGWLLFQLGWPGQITPFHAIGPGDFSHFSALPSSNRFAMK
ncbi:MAG: MBG domain-containing protein [Rhizomicrobium sp.]